MDSLRFMDSAERTDWSFTFGSWFSDELSLTKSLQVDSVLLNYAISNIHYLDIDEIIQ